MLPALTALVVFFFFFFNDTATTEIYTLSLHDALPIWCLLNQGIPMVIITLGSSGALVATGSLNQFIPGVRVKAIDCTAAGDVFNGALAVAVSEGKALLEAAGFANAAAAISVTRAGAQPSAPHRKEIERLLRRRVS